mgnify:CR=1 FL=1
MKLETFRSVLGQGCLVKLAFVDCNGYTFSGYIADLDDRYNDHEVIQVYNVDDPIDYDPYLRIVIE